MGRVKGQLVGGAAAPAAAPVAARLAWVDNLKLAVIAGVVVVHAASAYLLDGFDWYYDTERMTSQLWEPLLGLPALLGAVFVWVRCSCSAGCSRRRRGAPEPCLSLSAWRRSPAARQLEPLRRVATNTSASEDGGRASPGRLGSSRPARRPAALHALAQAAGQDLEAGLVQGSTGGRDLLHDLAAPPAGLDHADDAPDLALDPAQAGEHVGGGSLVELHDLTSS
jgi:hypothetical protein